MMSETATYLIVQHVADVFRRESRNVGVFVRHQEQIKAKFFGETEPGQIDARKTKSLPFPSAYGQWVRYWRRILAQRPDRAWDEAKATATDNYQVVDGGSVDRIGDDSIDDVVNYLYSALVSEGGIASALGAPDETQAVLRLADSVEVELKKLNLLDQGDNLFTRDKIRHPVRTNIPVEGAHAMHTLRFFQKNGHNAVMEPIDLTVKRDRKRMEERAGWASHVFEDILIKEPTTETIALIDATGEQEREDSAAYALKMLRPVTRDFFNWQSAEDRKRFISARTAMATAE